MDPGTESLITPIRNRREAALRALLLGAFLLLCAAGPGLALLGPVKTQASVPRPVFDQHAFWSGSLMPRIETWLQECSAVNYQIRGLYSALLLELGLLESPRVVMRGEWFFLREAHEPHPDTFLRLAPTRQARFRALAAAVQRAGVPLLVAVVPDKSTVLPEIAYASGQVPPAKTRMLEALLGELRAAGFEVIDLRPALAAAKKEAPGPFFRRDTHWNDVGALAAAQAIAAAIAKSHPEALAEPLEVRRAAAKPVPRMSDMIGMLGLRTATPRSEPSPYPEVRALQETTLVIGLQVRPPGGAWRAPGYLRPEAPIALAGTSFSEELRGALVLAAHVDVNGEGVAPAGGPLHGLLRALDLIRAGKLRPKVLVWEFVERQSVSQLWAQERGGK